MHSKKFKITANMILFILLPLAFIIFSCAGEEAAQENATQKMDEPSTATMAQPEQNAEGQTNEPDQPAEEDEADQSEPEDTNKEMMAKTDKPETEKKPAALTPVSSEVKLVPISIALPKPMFIGTPQNMQVPKLEKPLGKPRPPFLAPEGTKNVATGKSIASTDEAPIIGEIEMITDGDKEASDGSYVELGPFVQHITIDLGAKHDIYAILVWHFHKQPRVYFDVVVQTADDPDFTANVTTVYNNDLDNSAGLGVGTNNHYVETSEGRLIDAKGAQGRYVRLYSNGNNNNDLNHYIEVEVHGKPTS